MNIQLPYQVLFILHHLSKNGYDAYVVGGAVRDLLLNAKNKTTLPITDFDFTTNAKPEEIQALFPNNFYENDFGTVSITDENLQEQIAEYGYILPKTLNPEVDSATKTRIIDIKNATKIHESLISSDKNESNQESIIHHSTQSFHRPFEITTYRADGNYSDFRRPDSVSWGQTIDQDLKRRDFSINAIALSIPSAELEQLLKRDETLNHLIELKSDQYQLTDPFQGVIALDNKLITTVGNPKDRFMEDGLRLLRAIRFALQLNMEIDDETWLAIKATAEQISKISAERIRDELLKMLVLDNSSRAIKMLFKTGLLDFILPELIAGRGIEQAGHHTTDVWTHSLDALDNCPSRDPIVRLATLIHDIGKPITYKNESGKITFYNHEIVGSRIASKIARRLRLSKKDSQRLFILVRYHMFYYQPQNSDASIRRFMRSVGLENVDDILDLREGDRLGSGARKTSWRLEEMKARMIEQLHQPMEIKDMDIDGHDLMKEFNLPAGPILGEILQFLFNEVLEDSNLNQKSQLIELARRKFFSKSS